MKTKHTKAGSLRKKYQTVNMPCIINMYIGALMLLIICITVKPVKAQQNPGEVLSFQKISNTEGNFTGVLDNVDRFGSPSVSIGCLDADLDGDGINDLLIGAYADDDGGLNRGAVYILFMNADGTVKSHQKISDTQGNFTGVLSNNDQFGVSITGLGDLDKDGVTDVCIGAWSDDDGGFNTGAVWILFLNTDGTVKAHQKISSTQGGFTGALDPSDLFGAEVTSIAGCTADFLMRFYCSIGI